MVKTRAEELLEIRENLPPLASSRMVRQVSQHRREGLEDEFEQGAYREYPLESAYKTVSKFGKELPTGPTSAGFAVGSSKGFLKSAQAALTGGATSGGVVGAGGAGFRGPGGTVRQAPDVYSPLWLLSNLNLPRDRATINAWCRSFFALNPIVHNSITLHSTYPIAKLNIKCKNQKVEKFFSQMNEELGLMNICSQIAQEYWTLGEAFPYCELDERTAKWSRIIIQNPDYITVRRSVIAGEPIISLRPDENLRRIVFGNRPVDLQQKRQLDPAIIEHIKRGENIPLNNFYVSHLSRKISPYEIRGTGLIVSCFRPLMLFDRLRESKFVQASNMITPTTLVKIGDQEFRPTPADLEQWRDIWESAQYDPDFKIFTHNAVTVERVGWNQGILDTSADITQLIKEIYIGLMVPSVIMDGSDTTYATGSVALDVLRQRYMQFRNMLSSWLRNHIFAPISKLNDFYDYEDGEKRLIVPEVDWNHMSLFDMADYIQNLSTLAQGEGAARRISLQTLYRSLGLEYEDEQRKMRYEDIKDAVRKKELLALDRLSLSNLRSLGPDDEIQEMTEAPLPGEDPNELPGTSSAPPVDMSGGFGGLTLPPAPGESAPQAPIGIKAPGPPGGGTGIGSGGVPKPSGPS